MPEFGIINIIMINNEEIEMVHHCYQTSFLTLWLRRIVFATLQEHGDNFLQTLNRHGLYFSIFAVRHGLFSLVLMFPGLRIEAPPPSTVKGKCRYTFLKRKTKKLNFRSYVLNVVKINKSFLSFKGR